MKNKKEEMQTLKLMLQDFNYFVKFLNKKYPKILDEWIEYDLNQKLKEQNKTKKEKRKCVK